MWSAAVVVAVGVDGVGGVVFALVVASAAGIAAALCAEVVVGAAGCFSVF